MLIEQDKKSIETITGPNFELIIHFIYLLSHPIILTRSFLSSLSCDDNGVLTAGYNNGEARDLAQMAVAKFENNEDLFKMGKTPYKETRKSGQTPMGKYVESGLGEVLSKSIEQLNGDIAHEFVDMMMQRNFSANTKTISTAD